VSSRAAAEKPVSPAEHFSDLVGVDLRVHPGNEVTLPLERHDEHGALLLKGDGTFDGQRLASGVLYYLGTQRMDLKLANVGGGRVLLIGGPPFPETILMWWNFVARTPDEIRQARDDGESHHRFGDVHAYNGPRLAAPGLVRLAAPNPVS
jgi:redox-sensitive bicupin YhaK (pirin superfamily)